MQMRCFGAGRFCDARREAAQEAVAGSIATGLHPARPVQPFGLALHVDIDPRAGEDLEAERARALGLLTTNLPAGVPAPTVIVFSGGGYQGFWRLEEPIPINGDLAQAEDAKRYNQRLETLFGADQCHNIDRIMRLPGTVNVPDERKAKKGRVPMLAHVVPMGDWPSYPLSRFEPAPAVRSASPGTAGGNTPLPSVSTWSQRISAMSSRSAFLVRSRSGRFTLK